MNASEGSSSRSAAAILASAKKSSTKKRTDKNTEQKSLKCFGQFIQVSVVGKQVVSKSTTQADPNAKVEKDLRYACDLCKRSFSRACELANHKRPAAA